MGECEHLYNDNVNINMLSIRMGRLKNNVLAIVSTRLTAAHVLNRYLVVCICYVINAVVVIHIIFFIESYV